MSFSFEKIGNLLRNRVEVRVALVLTSIRGGYFNEAVRQALPLVGTEMSPWFLYARAWQELSDGDVEEAQKILDEARNMMESSSDKSVSRGFSFNWRGQPKFTALFRVSIDGESKMVSLEIEELVPGFDCGEAILMEDSSALLFDIKHNIRAYKQLFANSSFLLERVMHHELQTLPFALEASDKSGAADALLRLVFSSESFLRLSAETFWKVAQDWDDCLALKEVTSYSFYLLEEDEGALSIADQVLSKNPKSLIAGNVRALVLNRRGSAYLADEQWRTTLTLNPNRSSTYLILGHQSLCSGALEPALRYFQEAVVVGDNGREANRFLTAALDCLDDKV